MSADATNTGSRASRQPAPTDGGHSPATTHRRGARALARLARAPQRRRWRRCPVAPDSELALRQELGADHPLTTAIRTYRALRAGLATTAALLALAVIWLAFAGRSREPAVIASASELVAFAAAVAITRAINRERTIALLARGEHSSAPYVRLVAEQLTSEPHRRALAKALARAMWEAENLERIPIAKRPPPSVGRLCQVADELEAIVAALHTDAPISIEAVALCDRMIVGGYGSVLYAGDLGELRELLARIRYRIP